MATTNSDFLPNETGLDLGNPDQRWDGFFNDVVVAGSINGTPTVDGVQTVSSNQTLSFGLFIHALILATAGAGIILTLPPALVHSGQVIKIKKMDLTVGVVSIIPPVTAPPTSIDGMPTYDLTNQYQYVCLEAGNGSWQVVGNN